MKQFFVVYDYLYQDSDQNNKKAHDSLLLHSETFEEAYQEALKAFQRRTGQPLNNLLSFKIALM